MKLFNKTSKGILFSADVVALVWEKASPIQGKDPNIYRRDVCGAVIKKDMFAVSKKEYSLGWEIDHIKPLELGGSDDITNLQALQWCNNRAKDLNYPFWKGEVMELLQNEITH
jgi:5-methylcytosine-specific restriction endonuclease McrA